MSDEEMSLLAKAERYCANEEQCKTSVRKKLCDWGASVELSGKIIDKLVDKGFIDERRFAKGYCSNKLRTQKWGRLKVVYQLRSKQIPPRFITEGLADVPDEEYREIMRSVAQSKWDSYSGGEDVSKRRSKLSTFLASRGYESPEIQALVREFGQPAEPQADEQN